MNTRALKTKIYRILPQRNRKRQRNKLCNGLTTLKLGTYDNYENVKTCESKYVLERKIRKKCDQSENFKL